MKKNKHQYDAEQLKEAAFILKSKVYTYSESEVNDAINVAIGLIEDRLSDMDMEVIGEKFYAPAWVMHLLNRLSSKAFPLTPEEYEIYRDRVANLNENDFKPSSGNYEYVPMHVSTLGITEILAMFRLYFKLD